MEKKMTPKQHEDEISYRNSRGWLVAFSLFSFVVGIFYFIGSVYVISSPNNFDSAVLFNAISSLFLFSVFSPLWLFFIAYLYPDINEDEQGLHFKFLFKTYAVPWDEILYIQTAKPLGFKMRYSATLVVARSRLTFFHRLYGLIYGKTSNPSFLISSRISNYPSLTKAISEKVKANRRINKQ